MANRGFTLSLIALILASCATNDQEVNLEPKRSEPLFSKLDAGATGITFSNNLTLEEEANQFNYRYTTNGAGVGVADFNNDGLQDIYFVSNTKTDRIYLNKGGWIFEDITDSANLLDNTDDWRTGVTCADVNADGWMDIYVSRSGDVESSLKANLLYINQQDGTFKEQAEQYGIADEGNGTQSVFFDYDLDGDLDLYVMNHPTDWDLTNSNPEQASIRGENSDRLYEFDGQSYKDVSQEKGLLPDGTGFGLGLGIGYLNNDRYPDIMIGNDFQGRDYVYLNLGGKQGFEEVGKERLKQMSLQSMGVDICDLDNDGDADMVVLDMNAEDNLRQKTQMPSMDIPKFWSIVQNGDHYQYMYNTMQLNTGDGHFSEIGQMTGISNTDWSWSVLGIDLDLNGFRDLYITNGSPRDLNDKDVSFLVAYDKFGNQHKVTPDLERIEMYKATPLANYVYANKGDLEFTNSAAAWGLNEPSFSMGAAYADLDNDGDLDLITNNYNDTAFVYRNEAIDQNRGNFLTVNLKGPQSNPNAIGSTIKVETEFGTLRHDVFTTKGYQSSVPTLAHFGIPRNEKPKSLIIEWSDGTVQRIPSPDVNNHITVEYAGPYTPHSSPLEKTVFTDITKKNLSPLFIHRENPFNDFEEEVLLPHAMSRFGPALGVGDLNGDGLEDAIIGGAADQTSALYIQQPDGTLKGVLDEAISKDAGHEDVAVAVFDIDNDGDNDIYMGSGGNEHGQGSLFYQDRFYRNNDGKFTRDLYAIPDLSIATRTLAPNDFDNDGDIDLFVGAGHMPRQYGVDARSYLLRNDGGKLVDVTDEIAPELANIGMINQATWANIDGIAGNELILAGDWMPITVLSYNGSSFSNITASTGMAEYSGWFSAITAHDMDNDGDLDLLAGNLGLNYKYKASASEPFRLYAGDYDKSGSWDIALGYYNQGQCYPVRGRQCSSEQMPGIKKKFPTYREFGLATIYDVYGEDELKNGIAKEATEFASLYFENDGTGKFNSTKLPKLAQVSCINGFIVDDLNNDNHPDVVLAGNLFSSEVETPRNDASNGLVLIGDGKGNFEPKEVPESGFFAPGDVKNIRAIRLKKSLGVLVANNNHTVQLFRTRQ